MSKPYFTLTIYKFPDRLVAGSDSAFVSTAAELEFNRNPAIDVAADCLAAPRRNFEADSAAPLDHVQVAAVRAAVAAGRRHSVLCFSHDDACTAVRVRKRNSLRSNSFFFYGYGYENKQFFHGHINTQTILKFPDKLIGKRAPTTAVPRRTSAFIQQQSCSSQEIQRIASLDLAETLRPTALPHDSALHL